MVLQSPNIAGSILKSADPFQDPHNSLRTDEMDGAQRAADDEEADGKAQEIPRHEISKTGCHKIRARS